MNSNPVGVILGILATYALGCSARRFLNYATATDIPTPLGVDPDWWRRAIGNPDAGLANRWLGRLELILFYAGFLMGSPEMIGGYLVFKVGSKWEAWQNIVQVPDTIKDVDPIEYLAARNAWGTRTLMRFLVGTLYNVLCAVVGVTVTQLLERSP